MKLCPGWNYKLDFVGLIRALWSVSSRAEVKRMFHDKAIDVFMNGKKATVKTNQRFWTVTFGDCIVIKYGKHKFKTIRWEE